MERIPAFKPKTQEVEGSTQEKEKTGGPLQSLEKNKAQISGFNFALEAVLDGRITEEKQLRALAFQNFKKSQSGSNVLVDENSQFVRFGGFLHAEETLRDKRITGEALGLLIRLFISVNNPAFPDEVKTNFKKY